MTTINMSAVWKKLLSMSHHRRCSPIKWPSCPLIEPASRNPKRLAQIELKRANGTPVIKSAKTTVFPV